MNRSKMWLGVACVTMLAAGLLIPADAVAQGRSRAPAVPEIGMRAGWDFDADNWSLGGQARLPLGTSGFFGLVPSGDAFFGDDGRNWQLNGDLTVSGPGGVIYGGAGVAMVNLDRIGDGTTTQGGFNVLLGLSAPSGPMLLRPFAEGRMTFVNGDRPFHVIAGFNIALPGRNDVMSR